MPFIELSPLPSTATSPYDQAIDQEDGLADGGDLPPILDAAQVADLLGMNVQMVRRYAREGRLPAYKLPGGRSFRFFRDEVFAFLRSHPAVPESEGADVSIRKQA
jgi:excisionase family DNA binding protein